MSAIVPVSVAIVARNEEKNIRECLESVKDFEDIVVVDAYSDDETVRICREYTDRVYQHQWEGYSRQKQRAIDYTFREWVLLLDADERVTPGLLSEIVLKTRTAAVNGFSIPRKNFFLGAWIRHSGWWPDYTLRLFRKDASRVEPREVHEKVVVNGPVDYLREPLEHYSYRSLSDYIGKMENYTTLAARQLSNKGSGSLMCSMLVSPALMFLKMFFMRQGFRDGARGFMLATLYGFYTFLKYAKAWEMKKTVG